MDHFTPSKVERRNCNLFHFYRKDAIHKRDNLSSRINIVYNIFCMHMAPNFHPEDYPITFTDSIIVIHYLNNFRLIVTSDRITDHTLRLLTTNPYLVNHEKDKTYCVHDQPEMPHFSKAFFQFTLLPFEAI